MSDSRRCRGKTRGFDGLPQRDGDFEVENVWGFVKEMDSSSCMNRRKLKDYYSSPSPSSSSSSSSSISSFASASRRHPNTPPSMIPKVDNTSPNFEPEIVRQSSAPLAIPDWSKIYGKKTKISFWVDDGDGDRQDHGHGGQEEEEKEEEEEEEEEEEDNDDGDGEMVPPHEWIAKKLARSQISSFSVCEGIGRTLKGRDLSKVRNAILTKTGFLE